MFKINTSVLQEEKFFLSDISLSIEFSALHMKKIIVQAQHNKF